MSFSLNFPKSSKADFPAAVDAAVESPQQATPQGKALVATLKAAAKSIADQYDGSFPLQGSASGHVCEESPGSSPYDDPEGRTVTARIPIDRRALPGSRLRQRPDATRPTTRIQGGFMTTSKQLPTMKVTVLGVQVALGDVFESNDYRDTDPKQPNNRRRVRVVKLFVDGAIPTTAAVVNLTTLRETKVGLELLVSRKWRKVHDATKVAAGVGL